jgi:hypothetical protein
LGRGGFTAAGAALGAASGPLGSAAGIAVGIAAGKIISNVIGTMVSDLVDTSVKSLITLSEIAANTAQQARPFSADLIESKINNQLTQLYRNINRGEEIGPVLSRIERSVTTFQDLTSNISDKFIDIFGDMFAGFMDAFNGFLTLITPILLAHAEVLKRIFIFLFGVFAGMNPMLANIYLQLVDIGQKAKGKGRVIGQAINDFFNGKDNNAKPLF